VALAADALPHPTPPPVARTAGAPLGWRGPALAALVAAVTMCSRLWEGDIFRDEVLYAAVAKGIVTSGDWLNLSVGSSPYWNKPPLMFWLTALAYELLGVSVFSAKIVSALAGIGCCVLLYRLALRLFGDERLALVAAFVLATTPRFVRNSATFRLDSAVTFFTLAALLLYLRAAADGRTRDFAVAGLAWGLGVMAKGVFGLTGPFLFLIYLLVERRFDVLRSRGFLLSCAVGATVALPWHLYQLATQGLAFYRVYFGQQVVDRITGKLWAGPTADYFIVLLGDDWPWVALLAAGVVFAARAAWRGDRRHLFVLAWAFGYLLLLYASQGRRARYLHQFYPPAAILTAIAIARVVPSTWWDAAPRFVLRFAAALGVALALLPIPVHSEAARDLRALRPVLDTVAPQTHTPLVGFRNPSPNLRAACLFYLDRDLHVRSRPHRLPRAPGTLVLAKPDDAPAVEHAGFVRLYANASHVLLRPAAAP
jgi:4-amino-4-deoxy-L-arabinose transferase-like glycosyltransferase